MASEALTRELNYLGIDESTFAVLALLPLVQVAWADGTIQEQERTLILGLADEQWKLAPDAHDLLESWLLHPPSEDYITRGRRALVALAEQDPNFNLEAGALDDVVELAKSVARAAGGLFGFRSIDAAEAEVLEQIAATLHADGSALSFFSADEEEDVADEATDVQSPEAMQAIRASAGLVRSPRQHTLSGDELADLVHHGESGPSTFVIDENGLSIGRSRTNEVQLPHDHGVSRVHAHIRMENGQFYLVDEGTTNGTWVNGHRITRRRLFGAEQIRTGDAQFTFLLR